MYWDNDSNQNNYKQSYKLFDIKNISASSLSNSNTYTSIILWRRQSQFTTNSKKQKVQLNYYK